MVILDYSTMSAVTIMASRSIVLILCVTYILAGSLGGASLQPNEVNVDQVFQSYIKTYSKNYVNNSEREMRKSIVLENWKMINHHNRQNLSYTMKLNKFADRTPEELASLGGSLPSPAGLQGSPGLQGSQPFPYSADEVKKMAKTLPKEFDMYKEGYISSVKDQGSCASCWAFAAAGAVEGALARKRGGPAIDLSVQALVDCVPPLEGSVFGCQGNSVENAFDYLKNKGLPFEGEYPYKATDDTCHAQYMVTTTKIQGYSQATPNDPDAMRVALYYHGPVTVQMHLSEHMWFYDKGIFIDPECNSSGMASRNHFMVVVGYGTREADGVEYWFLKNSHGTDWGHNGFALISAQDDNCFILTDPRYPIV